MACLLAVGFLGVESVTNAASAGESILKPGESATNYLLGSKLRGRSTRIHLHIILPYMYYDYPYYYCRGYYPTHIGGYVYYPFSRSYYPRYGDRCSNLHRRCVAKGSGARRCL